MTRSQKVGLAMMLDPVVVFVGLALWLDPKHMGIFLGVVLWFSTGIYLLARG